ncbi:MAG: class B sortase [Eubacterium sp.]|nr:class B sortase [Eubacterium sp.]
MEQMQKKKKKVGDGVLIFGIILCVAVMAFSLYQIVRTAMAYRAGEEEYSSLRQYTTPQSGDGGGGDESVSARSSEALSAVSVSAGAQDNTGEVPISVDWNSLKAINDDIVGWLYIGALDLSYPVTHYTDNDFYLHRTFEKNDNFAGSIFEEYQNSADFNDPNTIIYGHNMKNGSMFGKLAQLEQKYTDDANIWLLTPSGNYCYRIFSMKKAAISDETYTLFIGTDEKFVNWCSSMKSSSDINLGDDFSFDTDSKVLTLSTCTTDSGHRFVVQAVRTESSGAAS